MAPTIRIAAISSEVATGRRMKGVEILMRLSVPLSQPPGFAGAPVSSGSVSTDEGELRVRVGQTIEQAERALIELTLEHTKNNKTRAAEILGISQKTLFNKLKEYGAQGAGAP